MAPATVMVISTIGTPPWVTDSAAKCASSAEDTLIAGTMPICLMRAHTSVLFMMGVLLMAGDVSFQAGRNAAITNTRFSTCAFGREGGPMLTEKSFRRPPQVAEAYHHHEQTRRRVSAGEKYSSTSRR